MAIKSDTVSVTTSATQVAPATWGDSTTPVGYQAVLLRPLSGSVTIGGASVTAGSGTTLNAANGDSLRIDVRPGEILYGISASGTVVVERLIIGDVA